MKTEIFNLKSFSVDQGNCLFKIGTDSILLGSWTEAVNPNFILDIGTGSGILALMMAQKFPKAMIQAVEIDHQSAGMAMENFRNSPWNDRLKAFHMPLQKFSKERSHQFDLIICNPPYFEISKFPNQKQNPARQTVHLNHEILAGICAGLINQNGTFALILPAENGKIFIELASKEGLFPEREMLVYSKPDRKAERILLQLAKDPTHFKKESLVLRDEDGSFSEAYQKLTRSFHPHY